MTLKKKKVTLHLENNESNTLLQLSNFSPSV